MKNLEELQHLLMREEFAEWDRQYLASCAEEKGMEKAKLEMVKKLLEKGIDIEIIIETTGLIKEEIGQKIRFIYSTFSCIPHIVIL